MLDKTGERIADSSFKEPGEWLRWQSRGETAALRASTDQRSRILAEMREKWVGRCLRLP